MAESQRLLLIGAKPGICDRALTLTDDILLIHKATAVDPRLSAQIGTIVLLDYEKDMDSFLQVATDAHRARKFHAMVCQTEQGLVPAALVGEVLGLNPNPTRVVRETRDKVLMRKRMAESGFGAVASAAGSCRADIERFAAEHGYPLIVKPRDGSASRGTTYIADAAQLEAIAPHGKVDVLYIDGGEFIIEEYLDGPEFSVECFSFNGHHTVFAITEQFKIDPEHLAQGHVNAYVEVAHKIPADIPPQVADSIRAYVRRFLTVMGVQNGPTHTELKLTRSGPRIVETHTRIAGDNIVDMVQLTTHHDLLQISVAWALGKCDPILESPAFVQGAAIRYFTPKPGIVRRVHGTSLWERAPGVVSVHLPLKRGDTVQPMRVSEDRVGYVMATGRTANEADSLCRRVCESIVIETIPRKPGLLPGQIE